MMTSPRSGGSFGGCGEGVWARVQTWDAGLESSPCQGPECVGEKARTSVTLSSPRILGVEGADGVVVAEGDGQLAVYGRGKAASRAARAALRRRFSGTDGGRSSWMLMWI